MAFIDLGDQFTALFEHDVEPRPEHRHFGLVVDDVATVVAAAHERGADIRGNNVGDPWGNRFDVVGYSEVQFIKTEPVRRALNAADLTKTDSALAELHEKGIEL
jgi:lactoylglutathione lyase